MSTVVKFKFNGRKAAETFQADCSGKGARNIRAYICVNAEHLHTNVYIPKKDWKPEVFPTDGGPRAA